MGVPVSTPASCLCALTIRAEVTAFPFDFNRQDCKLGPLLSLLSPRLVKQSWASRDLK